MGEERVSRKRDSAEQVVGYLREARNILFMPFQFIRNKTRPWRRRKKELKKKLEELEKINRTIAEMFALMLKTETLAQPRYADDRRLLKYGFKAYSQADEDGIIQEIFRRIGVTNEIFIEIGVGDGLENNTLFLLLKGWQGAWIEGNAKLVKAIQHKFAPLQNNGRLKIKSAWVQKDNINSLIDDCGLPEEVDLLSLDIDGNDYHVLENIVPLKTRVLVVEYNSKLPPPVKWVMGYNPEHQKTNTDYFGASLKSFEQLLLKRGYLLVGCNIVGVNAFFVRKDLVEEHFHADFSVENHYEPQRYWLINAFSSGFPPDFGPYCDDK